MTQKPLRLASAAEFAREHWQRLLMGAGLFWVFFGNAGFRSMVSNWLELRRLRAEIIRLDRDEKDLESKLKSMRSGDGAVERSARSELGYIKRGEIEYRFPPPVKGR